MTIEVRNVIRLKRENRHMKRMYICHTPYHLFIAIIRQLLYKGEAVLVLCRVEQLSPEIVNRLKKQNIFRRIYEYDHLDSRRELLRGGKETLLHRKRVNSNIEDALGIDLNELKEYDIYIFNDSSVFGYWMNINGIKYHLLEDALDNYKIDKPIYLPLRKKIEKRIKQLFRIDFSYWGESANYLTVEVNDISGICIRKKKNVIEVPRKELLHKLTKEDKAILRTIYLDGFDLSQSEQYHGGTLIITQPLSEAKIVRHETKMQIYQYLINHYGAGQVFIKPHPEDQDSYLGFQGCIVIPAKSIPLEVFDLVTDIHFKRAVTCFSTAITELENVEEKVIMGYEWVVGFDQDHE